MAAGNFDSELPQAIFSGASPCLTSSRRDFLAPPPPSLPVRPLHRLLSRTRLAAEDPPAISFGLVTYMWGADWDLPTLLENCKKTGRARRRAPDDPRPQGGAGPGRSSGQKSRKRFADSGVTCVGIGSDERFGNPDPAKVKAAIEKTKEFIRLSHDIGG